MVLFQLGNPLLFIYTKVAPYIIEPIYRRFGPFGLLALPWATLSIEKSMYDSFLALRGHDMYAERERTGVNPHGEFPSGGAALPSFSFVEVRDERSRVIISFLGDAPRKEAECVPEQEASR